MEASNAINKDDTLARSACKSYVKPSYIEICEKAEGRSTPPGCDVHHINGNHEDNRPENLIIVPDSMHEWLHQGAKKANPWMAEINWRDFRKELL